ncbi:hypothetical protein FHS04_002832 [Mesoflavibacter sabulilitoris]|nr:hypothetical protein [Mesoflavibacter zeaxanthinifaciens]MBB3125288.1 hypothetical protein [Mesoflavibacter zeaxanthinifaciens subsp. sabulilitoris]
MKKILFIIMLSFLFNCREDAKVVESNKNVESIISIDDLKKNKISKVKDEIILLLNNEKLDRLYFKQKILPLIDKLVIYNKDNYQILKKIGDKVSKETNTEAFNLGIQNLKNELKKS